VKHIDVALTLENGHASCKPARVEVDAGDTVRWTCQDGELAIDFKPNTPFTSTQVWKAHRGEPTPTAVVNADSPAGRVFQPVISINGTVIAESLGDIIIK
jgi:hypothetical protein